RDHAHRERDAEDADPEPGRIVPALAAAREAEALHDRDEEREAHRQDRKEIVVDDGERELQAVQEQGIAQASLLRGDLIAAGRVPFIPAPASKPSHRRGPTMNPDPFPLVRRSPMSRRIRALSVTAAVLALASSTARAADTQLSAVQFAERSSVSL